MIYKKLQTNVRTLIVLVACCGATAWAWHHVSESSREPTTVDWVNKVDSWNLDDRKRAVQKLLEAPPAEIEVVISGLTRALKDSDASVRVDAALALSQCVTPRTSTDQSALMGHARRVASSLFDVLEHDQDAGVRATAASGLASISRAAAKAGISADSSTASDPLQPVVLVAAIDAEMKRAPANRLTLLAAFDQLGQVPTPALPAVVEALEDPSAVTRGYALKALSHFSGGGVDRAIPVLLKDLQTNTERFAPDYLGIAREIRASPDVVPILIKALDGDDGLVREAAAALLGRIEPAPRAAGPALIAAVKKANSIGEKSDDDSSSSDDEGGGGGGGAVGPRSGTRPPPPAAGSVSADLTKALAKAAAPEAAVPLLIELLKRKSAAARSAAAVGLAEIGPAAHAAIPALVVTLKEASAGKGRSASEYGSAAARALGRIAPKAPAQQARSLEVIAALDGALKAGPGVLGAAAAEALRNFGPAAASAVPQLRKLLDSRHAASRENAQAAIEKIEEPSKLDKNPP